MGEITPLETRYKGYRFRSRIEARWAVFFDTLGVRYEYEPEGFDLGPAGWYLPDFWLPKQRCFVEIKREIPSLEERRKLTVLAVRSGRLVYMFASGDFRPLRYNHKTREYYGMEGFAFHPACFDPNTAVYAGWVECELCEFVIDEDHDASCPGLYRIDSPSLMEAYATARQERFEAA